jgi:hypothetical protein
VRAAGDVDRGITNQALRELIRVNGLSVGKWIKAYASEVITHNTKHGMQNVKDPQRLDPYYYVVSFLTPTKEVLEWICSNLP